jgi:phytoene dehydrogenase-like protein
MIRWSSYPTLKRWAIFILSLRDRTAVASITESGKGVMADLNTAVIIGGGVAGLSCGCYLQMNGYQTQILETNRDPGGLCVAWDRGPYVFDGCMSWLTGTHPASTFHRMWDELGAINGRRVVNYGEWLRVEGAEGQALSLSSDLAQLECDLKRIAPEDSTRINKLIVAARRCAPIDPPAEPLEVMGGREKMRLMFRYLPMLPVIFKWKNLSIADYAETYRSPFLRQVLLTVTGDPRMSALVLVMVLALRTGPNAGYVVGGSRALSEAIARRYTGLGGLIHYNTHAASIAVENGRATSVRCADGTVFPAATVISCADGHTTIFKMLEGRFVNRRITAAYENLDVFPGLIQASLGINQTFPATPPTLSLPLRQPLLADDTTKHDRLEVSVFGVDSQFCPPGKSVMLVRFATRYEYWNRLKSEHPAEYRKEKADLIQRLIEVLDQRFTGLAGNVEHADLATPASFERWTGNWQGSFQGWLPTPRLLGRRFPRTLPRLQNFYMAGHWVEPGGGLPPAALSGRYVAQLICARDRKAFSASAA